MKCDSLKYRQCIATSPKGLNLWSLRFKKGVNVNNRWHKNVYPSLYIDNIVVRVLIGESDAVLRGCLIEIMKSSEKQNNICDYKIKKH